jgi:hypothetical protein
MTFPGTDSKPAGLLFSPASADLQQSLLGIGAVQPLNP